jgi:hypothetical protein
MSYVLNLYFFACLCSPVFSVALFMPCSMISCIIYVLQYVVLGCLCSSVIYLFLFLLRVSSSGIPCCVFIFSSILCFIFYILQYVMLQCVHSLVFCVAFSFVLQCVVLCCGVFSSWVTLYVYIHQDVLLQVYVLQLWRVSCLCISVVLYCMFYVL